MRTVVLLSLAALARAGSNDTLDQLRVGYSNVKMDNQVNK